jgi:hypothetical protein
MAITFFGAASVPTDPGTNTTNPTAFANPPIGSMVAGDLCIIYAYCRTASATLAISNAGGQTWNSPTGFSSSAGTLTGRLFWCRFNGTWSAAPSVSFGATTNNSVVMLVFRPTTSSNLWAIDPTDQGLGLSALANMPSATTTTIFFGAAIPQNPSTVSIAIWSTDDDNTWGSLSGSGWSKASLSAQFRNTSGNDTSSTYAYNIKTSASTIDNVAQTEATNGADGGVAGLFVFYESSASINVTPGVGDVVLSGLAPTIQTPRNILADVGALAVAGFEPSVSVTNNLNVSAGFGELTLNGFEPTVEAAADINVLADVGSLTIDGFNPTVSTPKNILADTGEINIIGFDPSIQTPRNIQTDVGSVSITGLSPTVQTPRNIQSDLGEITISGLSPTVSVTNHISVTPGTGEIVLSGHEPAIGSNINITPSFGEISITGFAPAVNVTVSANTQTGVVDFNGFAPTVQTPVNINIGYGEILIDGFNPTINIGGGEALVETSTGMILISGLAPHVRGGRKQFIIKKSRVSNDANRFSTAVDESKQSQIGNADKHSTIEDGI